MPVQIYALSKILRSSFFLFRFIFSSFSSPCFTSLSSTKFLLYCFFCFSFLPFIPLPLLRLPPRLHIFSLFFIFLSFFFFAFSVPFSPIPPFIWKTYRAWKPLHSTRVEAERIAFERKKIRLCLLKGSCQKAQKAQSF